MIMIKIKITDLNGLKLELQNIDHININHLGGFINCIFKGLENRKMVTTLNIYNYHEINAYDEEDILIYHYSKEGQSKPIKIYYYYKDSKTEEVKEFYTKESALRFLYKMKRDLKSVTWKCEDEEDNNYLWRKYRP